MNNYLVYLAASCNGYHRALPGALLTYHILEEWCEELVKLQMRGWQNKGYAAKKKKDDNLHGI